MILTTPQIAMALTGGVAASLAIRVALRRHPISLVRRSARYLSDLFTPFATIARELRRANELKELELSERLHPLTGLPAPIVPITEAPSKHDTEVFFGAEDETKLSLKERMVAAFEREVAEED